METKELTSKIKQALLDDPDIGDVFDGFDGELCVLTIDCSKFQVEIHAVEG